MQNRSGLGIVGAVVLVTVAVGCGGREEGVPAPGATSAGEKQAADTAPGFREITLPFVEGAQPYRAAVGDIDADGNADVVVCGSSSDAGFVRVYMGSGTGDLVVARDIDVPSQPRGCVLADLNGDGMIDLATAHTVAGVVRVYAGDGSGNFELAQPLQLPQRPMDLAVGDINGDGRPDLVGVSEGGLIGVFYGTKSGRFERGPYLTTSYGGTEVVLADMDQDGDLDIVVSLWKEDQIWIFANDGAGRFGDPRKVEVTSRNPFGVAVLDVDRDGRLDFVAPDLGGNPLDVRLGTGSSEFRAGPRLPSAAGARHLMATDLDGDGHQDLVSTARDASRVILYYNRGGGRFLTQDLLEPGEHPRATVAADLNGDGVTDLVTTNQGSGDVTVFLAEPESPAPLHEVRVLADQSHEELEVLKRPFRRALRTYRLKNYDAAIPAFERIVEVGTPLFEEGSLLPDHRSQEWIRFHASVLLLSDYFRYTAKQPERSRDLELRLADTAERLGHVRLAAVQRLAVGEIEEQALANPEAATQAYEAVVRLGDQTASPSGSRVVPRFLVDTALLGIDRIHALEEGYHRRLTSVSVPYNVDLAGGEVTRWMLPHLEGYSRDQSPVKIHQAFARSHAGSFRGAFADYAAVLVAIMFPGRFVSGLELADKYVEWYPDRVFTFAAFGQLLTYFHGTKRTQGFDRRLDRAEQRASDLGIEIDLQFDRTPS